MQGYITRKKLESDPRLGELTLKIEHGIRSQLHGNIEYDVFDDLVQTAWTHLWSQPEEQRTAAKAYNYGRKAAERHWSNKRRQLTDQPPEVEEATLTDDTFGLSHLEALWAKHSSIIRKELAEDWPWLIDYIDTPGFKSKADTERANVLLSRLKAAT